MDIEQGEIKLNVKPRCVAMSTVFKRKLYCNVIPFIIALGIQLIAQIIISLTTIWATTPYITAPIALFLFFTVMGSRFSYRYQNTFGSTRTQNYLTSYAVAAIYSAAMVFFSLGVAILLHYYKFYSHYTVAFFLTTGDIIKNIVYGLSVCMLMYPLSSILLCFNYEKHIILMIAAAAIVYLFSHFGVLILGQHWQSVEIYGKNRTAVCVVFFLILLATAALDFYTQKRSIKK